MNVARLTRAVRRSPRYLAWRLLESARHRTRRPWSQLYPRLVTERVLLGALGASNVDALWSELASQPFFVDAQRRAPTAEAFTRQYGGARAPVIRSADAALAHEFDLLGSGPQRLGASLPWHTDFKTGRQWPLEYSAAIEYTELDRPSDVKVPWELSRCQHFTRLGQAYWLTGDERYAAEFVAETSDWISANPFARGVNWACAMDVALRAVSWIWAFHFFAGAAACRDAAFRSRFLRALYLHGAFIIKFLEKGEVNGNHYLCDGVGLVFLGCLFRRSRAGGRWLTIGRSIVEQEIFNQTTEDGVDFEQATAYHRLVLEAFLTSYLRLRLADVDAPPACWSRLERMCEFVAAYTKPNGLSPLIGDNDDGRVQLLGTQTPLDHRYLLSTAALLFNRADFKAAAGRCWDETFWLIGPDAGERFDRLPSASAPPRSVAFPSGGVYVLRTPTTHLVVDCAEVGLGGRGGHGHNDMLSFELFLNGANIVTDCGAYLYTASREWRDRFRSTAFHNGVQVDGEELNRFLGPDRLWYLQYDAKPIAPTLTRGARVDVFSGAHSGYERLDPPVSHARRFIVDREQPRVLLRDTLGGGGRRDLVWRFHFDPSVRAAVHGYDVCLSWNEGSVWLMPIAGSGPLTLSLEDGWVSPAYGVKVPAAVAVWRGAATLPVGVSFLFAERQLSLDDRVAASAALETAADAAIGS